MPGPRRAGPRRALAALYLWLWGASLLAVGVVLMAGHWVALPGPARDDAGLARELAGLEPARGATAWVLTHVLYAECRCSRRIFEHIAERPTPAGVHERVLLIGRDESWERHARERSIELVEVDPTELRERFGIESAPLLLVADPQGRIRYRGGHTARKQGLDDRDIEILEALREGREAAALPVYGCAVSRELQSILDPIGIKYAR